MLSTPPVCSWMRLVLRNFSCATARKTSAQKRLMQAAVHGHNLAGGFAQTLGDQQEIRFRLVGWRDGRFGQGAVGIELRELLHERFRRLVVFVGNVVFSQRADDAVA